VGCPAGDALPGEGLSIDTVLEGLDARSRGVLETDSFYVEYKWGNVEHLAESRIVDRIPGVSTRNARRGSYFYCEVQLDPGQEKWTSHTASVYRPDDGVQVSLKRGENPMAAIEGAADPTIYQFWDYTDNLHLNVYQYVDGLEWRRAFPPGRQPLLIPEDIRARRDEFRLLPDRELIDGVECCVIERPGVVRFALDPSRSFAVMRTEQFWSPEFWPKAGEHPDTLRLVRTHHDFREVKPGVWLPFLQRETLYADPNVDTAELWGRPVLRWNLRVGKLEFDTLTTDFFRVEIPDGTVVQDNIRKIEYLKSATGELPFGDALLQGKQGTERGRWLLIVNALVAAAFVGGFLLRKLLRRAPAKPD
jgi:hypothetical protein